MFSPEELAYYLMKITVLKNQWKRLDKINKAHPKDSKAYTWSMYLARKVYHDLAIASIKKDSNGIYITTPNYYQLYEE